MASMNFRNDPRLSKLERGQLREFCGSLDSDIVELANALGIKVFVEDMFPYEKGYLEYDPICGSKSSFKIVINQNIPIEVQRFTVAHELAHFLLHREDAKRRKAHRVMNADLNNPFVYIEGKDKMQEREANAFASALLMPPNLFKPAFARFNGSIDELGRLFCLSQPVIVRRINELGLKSSD